MELAVRPVAVVEPTEMPPVPAERVKLEVVNDVAETAPVPPGLAIRVMEPVVVRLPRVTLPPVESRVMLGALMKEPMLPEVIVEAAVMLTEAPAVTLWPRVTAPVLEGSTAAGMGVARDIDATCVAVDD